MPGYLPGQGEHRPMYTSREFCLGVFDILADHKYDGLVVSEVDMAFQNRFDLQMDVLLYEGWVAARRDGSRDSWRNRLTAEQTVRTAAAASATTPSTTASATDHADDLLIHEQPAS